MSGAGASGQVMPWLAAIASQALDFIYTPQCALCEGVLHHGRALCDACDGDLPRLPAPFCAICGEPFEGRIEGDFQCRNCCELAFAFEFARPAMRWDERTRELIHQLKYHRAIHLAAELGRLAAEAFADERLQPALDAKWPLVPVPLHRSRFQHRTFNQAAEIARVVAEHTGLPVVAALKRTRRTDTQTLLGRRQRLKNLQGAFALTHAGRRQLVQSAAGVILIDDVLTTGSTVDACALTLRHAGFKRVWVVTVMRG
jgi:ComF family protein